MKKWLEKFKVICHRFHRICKAYEKSQYYDCGSIIIEEKSLLPISYYYLYSQEEIAKMEEEAWKELEKKIKEL